MNFLDSLPTQEISDLGFFCAVNGLKEECVQICAGLELAHEDSPLPHLIHAILHLNLNDPSEALQLLNEKAIPLDPENQITQSLIAMANMQAGDIHKGKETLSQVLMASTEDESRNLAKNILSLEGI